MDSKLLDRLVAVAREHKMTPAERFDQRVSFIYGQMSGAWTKEQVRAHLIERDGLPVGYS